MAETKKYYSVLQSLEVVNDGNFDVEVFSQRYKIPKSGQSPVIENGSTTYKFDFKTGELVLISVEGKEFFRKKIDPEVFVRCEYKWLKIAREEARITLGIDDVY